MKNKKYNQYEDVFTIDDGRNILVNFIKNKIEIYDKDVKFTYQYCEEEEKISKRLDDRILSIDKNSKLVITFITSLKCNMKCKYCYERDLKIKSSKLSSSSKNNEMDSLINSIKFFYIENNYSSLELNILGGEPLLEENIVYLTKFIDKIRKIDPHMELTIITNGLNVNKFFDTISIWDIDNIQITIDGIEKTHNKRRPTYGKITNSFSEIEKGLDRLIDSYINVFIRVNVDRYNVSEIPLLANFIIDKKWIGKNIKPYIYPVTDSNDTYNGQQYTELDLFTEVIDTLQEESNDIKSMFKLDFHGIGYIDSILKNEIPMIRASFCGAENGQIIIDPNYRLINCWWGLEEEFFRVGEIDNESIFIDEDKIESFKKRNTINSLMIKCKKCKYKYLCGGGCVFKEYMNKGTIYEGNCSEFYGLMNEYINFIYS